VHHICLSFVVRSIQHDGETYGRVRSGKSVWILNRSLGIMFSSLCDLILFIYDNFIIWSFMVIFI
jgi:hypothetical protein